MPDPLTPEVQKEFDNYFDMFSTEGYKQLVRDVKDNLRQQESTAVARCKTNDDWQFERGVHTFMKKIISFEEAMRAQYEQLTNPEAEDEGNTLEDYG